MSEQSPNESWGNPDLLRQSEKRPARPEPSAPPPVEESAFERGLDRMGGIPAPAVPASPQPPKLRHCCLGSNCLLGSDASDGEDDLDNAPPTPAAPSGARHDKHVLLSLADGPEGIEIYESEEQAVVDWADKVPALYLSASINGATVRLGPFNLLKFPAVAASAARVRELQRDVEKLRESRDKFGQAALDNRREIERLRDALTRTLGTVWFFASVIKSGENWSVTCQESLEQAHNDNAALAPTGGQPKGGE